MASSSTTSGAVGSSDSSSRHEVVEEYKKSSLVDDFEWVTPIERLFYFDAIDHLLAFQANQSSFNVFKGKRLTHHATVKGHTSEMLSAEYIPKFHFVASSANDRTIRFWDATDHYKPVKNLVVHSDHTQICMRWAPQQSLLFTSTDQKQLRAFRIEKSNTMVQNGPQGTGDGKDGMNSSFITAAVSSNKNKLNHYTTEVVSTFSGQNDIALDLLVLENMSSLASASLDTTIALFDINTHVRTSVLKNGHKKGVFQLAYHPEYHVLVSAGFESSAIVWNPYCAKVICKLKGHYSPLTGVQCVPNSPQILTADQSGIIKVWDIRNFSAVQTIYIEDEKDSRVDHLNTFVALTPHKRIISCSHKLFVHDSLTSSSFQAPNIADLEPTIKCLYNTTSGTFITASGTTVKIWNASNGVLERAYRGVLPEGTEITALCLDDAQKKFITGDTSGTIRVFNYLNGTRMKSVTLPSAREITSISYIPQLKNVLSTAWDGSISLWDENEEQMVLIKRLKMAPSPSTGIAPSAANGGKPSGANAGLEIITSAYSENLTLFATGSSSGLIHLWDYRSHVLVGELLGHASEITAMAFLDPYPLLVSSDNEGNICFWVVRPLILNVGKCVLRLVNTTKGKAAPLVASRPGSGSGGEICPVTALAFWTNVDARTWLASYYGDENVPAPPSLVANVYAGDVNGVIRCWDISGALKRWNMLPFFSHDRLVPTGSEGEAGTSNGNPNGGQATGDEESQFALTDAELRRVQKQIQANGLSAGAASKHKIGGGAPGEEHDIDRTAALPQLVAKLASDNISAFSRQFQLLHRAQGIGQTMGAGSVEYEAALAAVPGATARHWSALQQARRQTERLQQDMEQAAAAAKAQEKSMSGPVQRRRQLLEQTAAEEEKSSDQPDGLVGKSPNLRPFGGGNGSNTASAAALPTDASKGATDRATKLAQQASVNKPIVANNFQRGAIKLMASGRKTVLSDSSKPFVVPTGSDDDTSKDDEIVAAAAGGRFSLPSIPLLPLNLLTPHGGTALSSSLSSYMPKAILRHSRTNDYVEYRRTHREVMNLLEKHARNRTSLLEAGDLKLIHWWIAHTDSVRDMHVVREEARYVRGVIEPRDPKSEALLSCSFDKKVCLWDRTGRTLGHLQQGRTDDVLSSSDAAKGGLARPTLRPDWSFASDVRGRYERGQATARNVLHRLSTARPSTEEPARATFRAKPRDEEEVFFDEFPEMSLEDSRPVSRGDTFLTELEQLMSTEGLAQLSSPTIPAAAVSSFRSMRKGSRF
jgi:WD40 repeat protein